MKNGIDFYFNDGYSIEYNVPLNRFFIHYDIKKNIVNFVGAACWDDLGNKDQKSCFGQYTRRSLPNRDESHQKNWQRACCMCDMTKFHWENCHNEQDFLNMMLMIFCFKYKPKGLKIMITQSNNTHFVYNYQSSCSIIGVCEYKGNKLGSGYSNIAFLQNGNTF